MKKLTFIGIILLMAMQVVGQDNNLNLGKSKKALQGYDPVSYFTEGKAIEGKKEFSLTHKGALYLFQNEENKKLFEMEPSNYPIGYGGWCAYAMGVSGDKVKIDPETFKITNGTLYLFYNFYFNNTLTKWNEDEPNLKLKADENWDRIVKN